MCCEKSQVWNIQISLLTAQTYTDSAFLELIYTTQLKQIQTCNAFVKVIMLTVIKVAFRN